MHREKAHYCLRLPYTKNEGLWNSSQCIEEAVTFFSLLCFVTGFSEIDLRKVHFLQAGTVQIQPMPSNGGKLGRPCTYMALVIQFVVGELQLVETDHLSHPSLPWGRRVWMNVHPGWHRGISVARHHPFRAVVNIPRRQGQGSVCELLLSWNFQLSRLRQNLHPLKSLKFDDLLFTFQCI